MRKVLLLVALLALTSTAKAASLSDTCKTLADQIAALGPDGEKTIREMGMGKALDICAKEIAGGSRNMKRSGTRSASSANSGSGSGNSTLSCKTGNLCATYDFQYASDRQKYASSCAVVNSCSTSNITDKCSVSNDKVRGGKGTVNWTIYAYNGLVRDTAANLKCD